MCHVCKKEASYSYQSDDSFMNDPAYDMTNVRSTKHGTISGTRGQ